MSKSSVQSLIYSDEFQDFLELLSKQFKEHNVFTIAGMGHQEIKHSRTLGWLMGSKNSLNGKFFFEFAKNMIETTKAAIEQSEYPVDNEHLESFKEYLYLPAAQTRFKVKYEYKDIDILLEDQDNKTIVYIENKVFASESKHQLNKYREIIQNEYAEWKQFGVFMTPYGDEPNIDSVSSDENRQFYFISSYQDIKGALENVLAYKWPNEQTMILEHYLDLLVRSSIVSNSKIEEFCTKIWSNDAYKEALEILIQNKPDKYAFIQEYINNESDLRIVEEKGTKTSKSIFFQIGEIPLFFRLAYSNEKGLSYVVTTRSDCSDEVITICKSIQKIKIFGNTVDFNRDDYRKQYGYQSVSKGLWYFASDEDIDQDLLDEVVNQSRAIVGQYKNLEE